MDNLKGHESPINKTAAIVTSVGYSYETKTIRSDCLFSENGLKTRPTPKGTVDLSGMRSGRFTVIGVSSDSAKLKWVVRCSCGNFEVRSARCIKKNLDDQMCIKCYSALQAIKKAAWAAGNKKNFEEYIKDRS